MTDYIKREDAVNAVRCVWLGVEAIKAIPAADVEEVRHGEWLMPLTDESWQRGYFCRCSVCKGINHGHTLNVPNFCENCGAKMDVDILSGYIPYEDGGY